jgi:hypothetical protein
MYAITDSTCQDILRSLCGLLFKQTVRRLVLQEQRKQRVGHRDRTRPAACLHSLRHLLFKQTRFGGCRSRKGSRGGFDLTTKTPRHKAAAHLTSDSSPCLRAFVVRNLRASPRSDSLCFLCALLFQQTVGRLVLQEITEETESWAPGSNSSGALPPFSPSPPVQNKTVRRLVLPEHAEAAEDDKLMG